MNLLSKINSNRLKILVLGYIIRGPMGGMTWHHLQYILGLSRMGHDVYFLEDSGDSAYCCYDPLRHVTDTNPGYGLHYADEVFKRVGLGNKWAYYDHHEDHWHGPSSGNVKTIIKEADLLLNLSCSNAIRPWLSEVPLRVLVDTDPLFAQARNLSDPDRFKLSSQHNAFFTFGENIGHPLSRIPDDGFPWQPTRQPVVMDAWPVLPGLAVNPFTTVMKWESYPGVHYKGRFFGQKAESFAGYWDLPRKTKERLEIALSDKTAPRNLLSGHGWNITYPFAISSDPWKYQEYIQQSKGEFSIAKHGYVAGNTGWFSERSAGYMASGRPVILQDTGFSNWMETGKGVICFQNPEEAIEGIELVSKDYLVHCAAARELSAEYFDASQVLDQLISKAYKTIDDSKRFYESKVIGRWG